jgi:hypothetical protein
VQETSLRGSPDLTLLDWALDNDHILVTHDRRTMLQAMHEQMISRGRTASVVIVKRVALSRAIDDLELLLRCATEDELENQVVFITF